MSGKISTVQPNKNSLLASLSPEVREWLIKYCLASASYFSEVGQGGNAPILRPRMAHLEYEVDGDYSRQIDRLHSFEDNLPVSKPQLTSSEMVQNYRYNVLLGKHGGGKSYQLQNLFVRQNRLSLSYLEKYSPELANPNRFTSDALLTVYLDLTTAGAKMREITAGGNQNNLFEVLLTANLEAIAGTPPPPNLFNEVSLLLLMDGLEGLDPNFSNIFLYRFNQWLGQTTTENRLLVACHDLSFSQYQPWFKAEQQWQVFAMGGLVWREVQTALSSKYSSQLLIEIESTGLENLFTHPALYNRFFLYPLIDQDSLTGILTGFLEITLGDKLECAEQLVDYSQLLHGQLVAIARQSVMNDPHSALPEGLDQALNLGVLERHPIMGWTRLASHSVDSLVAVWYCQQLEIRELTQVFNHLLGKLAENDKHSEITNFLKLLYLVTSKINRLSLITAFLGKEPDLQRFDQLVKLSQNNHAFGESWEIYLSGLLRESDNRIGQNICRLVIKYVLHGATPGEIRFNPPFLSKETRQIAEITLDLLLKHAKPVWEDYLEIGQVQERLGRNADAMLSYRYVLRGQSEVTGLPVLEGGIGVTRLLAESGKYDEATSQLSRLNRKIQEYQAEINYQLSLVKRKQNEPDSAVEFAEQAVNLSEQPLYRYNLATVLHAKGSLEAAERELVRLSIEYPSFADAFNYLGSLQAERGATELALTNLKRAVELNPGTAQYLYDLGRSLFRQNRPREAHAYLRAAAAQDSTKPQYQALLGKATLKLNNWSEARNAFLRALELAKTGESALEWRIYLAAIEFAAGDYAQANKELAPLLSENSQSPVLLLISGMIAEAEGRFETALGFYRNAATIGEKTENNYPAVLQLHWNLGLARALRMNLRDMSTNLDLSPVYHQNFVAPVLEESATCYRTASLFSPDNPEVLLEAGQQAMAQRHYVDAAKLFREGAVNFANQEKETAPALPEPEVTQWLRLFAVEGKLDFELNFWYAVALREMGQNAQAQKVVVFQLRKIGAEHPADDLQATRRKQDRLAALYHQLGLIFLAEQKKEALQYLAVAADNAPENPRYRLSVAKAYLQEGNSEKALSELNQARSLEPVLAEVFAQIAEIQLTNKLSGIDRLVYLSSLNLYLRALEAEAGNLRYLYKATLLSYHLPHQNQTAELMQKLLNLAPDNPSAHILAACNYERGGNLERAQAEVNHALTQIRTRATIGTVAVLVAARLARKTHQRDKLKQALAILNSRSTQDNLPSHVIAAIRAEEGLNALNHGQFEQAGELYQEALRLCQAFEGEYKLDDLFYYESDFGEVKFSAALVAKYKVGYANALMHTKQYGKALAQIEEAVKLNKQYAAAYELQSEVMLKQGFDWLALEPLKTATELEPTAQRYYQLGLLYLRLEEIEPAVETLELASSNRNITSNSAYYSNLGTAYQKAGNNIAARAAFTRGLQLAPQDSELHVALAQAYLKDDDLMSAIQPLQEAVAFAPQNPQYRLELAQVYEELGWTQESAKEYGEVTNLTPNDPQVWLMSGRVHLKLGQAEQARNAFNNAVRLDENLAAAHYELGKFYLETFRANQADSSPLPPDFTGMYV